MRHDLRNLLHNFSKVVRCGVITAGVELIINFHDCQGTWPCYPGIIPLAEIVERNGSEKLAGGTIQELNSKGNSTRVIGEIKS